MRVTTWAEYGLLVAVHLARRAGEGPIPARELAEDERLPHDYVEQILLRLRRAGLVASVRGAKGGYYLARPGEEVTVRDVITASERTTFEVNCDVHPVAGARCGPGCDCAIRPVWRLLERRINETLTGITLAHLVQGEAAVAQFAGVAVEV